MMDVLPASCPWCGEWKKVYVRFGSELVCTDCAVTAETDEAIQGDEHVD